MFSFYQYCCLPHCLLLRFSRVKKHIKMCYKSFRVLFIDVVFFKMFLWFTSFWDVLWWKCQTISPACEKVNENNHPLYDKGTKRNHQPSHLHRRVYNTLWSNRKLAFKRQDKYNKALLTSKIFIENPNIYKNNTDPYLRRKKVMYYTRTYAAEIVSFTTRSIVLWIL